jgi:hypothetical protein
MEDLSANQEGARSIAHAEPNHLNKGEDYCEDV